MEEKVPEQYFASLTFVYIKKDDDAIKNKKYNDPVRKSGCCDG